MYTLQGATQEDIFGAVASLVTPGQDSSQHRKEVLDALNRFTKKVRALLQEARNQMKTHHARIQGKLEVLSAKGQPVFRMVSGESKWVVLVYQ